MSIEIPIWFYSYSIVAYAVVALTSFLISLFAFKLYRASNIKSNRTISLGFFFLGLAFSFLTATSSCTYFYGQSVRPEVDLGSINYIGYNLYYISSILSYLILVFTYLPNRLKSKFLMVYLPLWYIDSESFHILSILLLAYVIATNIFHLLRSKKRSRINSYLVTFCFISMLAFHLLLLLTSFNVSMYLAALAVLSIGFGSLLTMLIRVSER